ncbi:hypothetical protein PV08_01512 [Exophiala spinifera]|uniref:PEP phosphonomutase n=1 Tax=Exophiala spinifera TaxID=91928 RepID=A0A0D2BPP5_9EURO|nr:uncharacterized protein PV08_01512 [Exophiala spinifera]KIW20933.1 hypothetical protein PV08_01512 [Exophiala spinifera]
MASEKLNDVATVFQNLHRPGKPVVLANVYDGASASVVAPLASCAALATASYAVAKAAGTEDDELTLEQNLRAVRVVAKVAARHDKPLSADLQDGYGDRLAEAVTSIVQAGVVGINLEDCDKDAQQMYPVDVAVERITLALKTARDLGVPNFVVNARCDTLVRGGGVDEVIARGKRYLDAGATTVFVWGGGRRGVSRAEVERMVQEFDGRLSVSYLFFHGLSVKELAEIGVARISVGPKIQAFAMKEFAKRAEELLDQGR